MKTFAMDLILKDHVYQECGSPILPIPFSMEDMDEIRRTNGITQSIVADNLLQMVETNPEKNSLYHSLLVHFCLNAGGEAAAMGNHRKSNYYFVSAAKFSPISTIVRKNLARSYQHLGLFHDAITNYEYVIKEKDSDEKTWVFYIECLYAIGESEAAKNLLRILAENTGRSGSWAKQSFGITAISILSDDNAPEGLKLLANEYFLETE